MNEWIKRMLYTHPHNEILFGHKEKEILPLVTTWMNLEAIMLSGINQVGNICTI